MDYPEFTLIPGRLVRSNPGLGFTLKRAKYKTRETLGPGFESPGWLSEAKHFAYTWDRPDRVERAGVGQRPDRDRRSWQGRCSNTLG